jgi:hypothetical protein
MTLRTFRPSKDAVRVHIKLEGASEEETELDDLVRAVIKSARVELVTEQGKTIIGAEGPEPRGVLRLVSEHTRRFIARRFDLPSADGDRPKELRITCPVEYDTKTVDFEFRDVPLP